MLKEHSKILKTKVSYFYNSRRIMRGTRSDESSFGRKAARKRGAITRCKAELVGSYW